MSIVKRFRSCAACVCVVIGCTSCLAVTNSDQATDTQQVKTNADLALAQCGQGNIKSVSTKGFECKH